MAVKTVQYIFNGQTYNLTFDASTGEYKATEIGRASCRERV